MSTCLDEAPRIVSFNQWQWVDRRTLFRSAFLYLSTVSISPMLSNVPCCRWRGTPVSGARPAFPSPTTTRAPSECAPPPPPTWWCSRSPPPPPPPSHTTRRGSHYLAANRDTMITLQINFSLFPCFSLPICVPASRQQPQAAAKFAKVSPIPGRRVTCCRTSAPCCQTSPTSSTPCSSWRRTTEWCSSRQRQRPWVVVVNVVVKII